MTLSGKTLGRPRLSNSRTRTQRNVVLDKDRAHELEDICATEGISFSEKIRQLIDDELDRKKALTPNAIGVKFEPSRRRQSTLLEFVVEHRGYKEFIQQLRRIQGDKNKLQSIERAALSLHMAAKSHRTGVYNRV